MTVEKFQHPEQCDRAVRRTEELSSASLQANANTEMNPHHNYLDVETGIDARSPTKL